jgi:predicted DNA-binding transcriptional regulator AlpA
MSPAPAKVLPNEKPSDAELRQKQLAAVLGTVRVMDRAEVIEAVGVSPNTWERMEKDGETPPITKLSKRRIGYRVVDLVEWLDARRQSPDAPATEPPNRK